jgi:S-adenosyl-L-methionine hydrolase (adenosine-forming)
VPRRHRRGGRPPLVTLSSDLGAAYAAQMKAVLARRLGPERWVDLAHDLRPHAISEAGFLVRSMAERFPPGTVHVVVVDPGVGGRRAPVAVACRDGSCLVGPDNGVLAPLASALGGGTAYRIDPSRLGAAPRVGTTFDGRDVFAPAAVLLASGRSPSSIGTRIRLRRAALARPRRVPGGATGTVVHVDRFGNLITDVPTGWLPPKTRQLHVRLGGRAAELPLVKSYEEGGDRRLVALGSSFGTLELAVARSSAAEQRRVASGAAVRFAWDDPRRRRVRRNGKYRPT